MAVRGLLSVGKIGVGWCLFFFVGIAPFVMINSIYAELPIFVHWAPEGNSIGAYIGPSYNIANVFLVFVVLFLSLSKMPDWLALLFLLLFGILSTLLAIFLWKSTISVNDTQISVFLLLFSFSAGVTGCFSMVVVFSFSSHYHLSFTAAMSAGMGVGGILAAILADIQRAGAEPRFSVSVFLVIVAIQMIFSIGALVTILVLFGQPPKHQESEGKKVLQPINLESPMSTEDEESLLLFGEIEGNGPWSERGDSSTRLWNKSWKKNKSALEESWDILLSSFWTSAMTYFFLPGLEPFIVVNHDWSDELLLIMTTGWMAMNFLARTLCSVLPLVDLNLVNFATTAVFLYLLLVAVFRYPLLGYLSNFMIILCVFLLAFSNGYVATCSYMKPNISVSKKNIQRVERWVALSNQAGCLTGTFLCSGIVAMGAFSKSWS